MGHQVSVAKGQDGRVLRRHALKESYSTSNLLEPPPTDQHRLSVPCGAEANPASPERARGHRGLVFTSMTSFRPHDVTRHDLPDNSEALGQSHFFISPITSNESEADVADPLAVSPLQHEPMEASLLFKLVLAQHINWDEAEVHHDLQDDTPYLTFKIHPSEHDLLNPIDTLLHPLMAEVVPEEEDDTLAEEPPSPALPPVFQTVLALLPNPQSQVSPLLALPLEVLYRIIEIVYYDDNVSSINDNLESFANTIPLLLRKLNQLLLCFLYRYAIFNRPHSFDKFLSNLNHNRFIGKYVEFMDFQQFTLIGLGRTGRMNQEIEMVTLRTITAALLMTPNLIEFLALENIQDDMDVNVLDYLFNRLYKIQAIDFCGALLDKFTKAFVELIIDNDIPANPNVDDVTLPQLSPVMLPVINPTLANTSHIDIEPMELKPQLQYEIQFTKTSSLSHLYKLSFHDCSLLTSDIFIKVLPHLHHIRRLDLTHTSITLAILNQYLPTTCRLTHLLLLRCLRLTTKDLINFLTQHPAVANDTLRWLNLQIDSNVVSPLSDIYLIYTLKHIKALQLEYLNLLGLPIKNLTMMIIKQKFPLLKSLLIGHSNLTLEELNNFVQGVPSLKYIDLLGMKLSRFNILSFLKANFNSHIEAVEFDYKILYEASALGDYIKIVPQQQLFLDPVVTPQVWKFYDNEGRRAWIYKLLENDPTFKLVVLNDTSLRHYATSNLTYYDMETGKKIVQKVKQPQFLKYALRKINCLVGYMNMHLSKSKAYLERLDAEDIWPVEFSQRGIYNYYSLNVK